MKTIFQGSIFEPATDYPTVCEWWKGHGKDPLPLAIFPKLGVLVHEEKEGAVACLWLYMDNSVGVCFLEHAVANPLAKPRIVAGALHFGTEFLKKEAAGMGYGIMLLRAPHSIARRAVHNGFVAYETGVTCMVANTAEVSKCRS